MSLSVFLMVIAAAILHAGWNVLVKINADKIVTITLIKVTQICLALMLIPFVEFPAQAAWPYMVSSAVIHTAYFYALTMSYRLGEFGYVYPVSRGTAPLVVAAGSTIMIGELLTDLQILSICLIAGGIMSLAFAKGNAMRDPKALGFALVTGICIAGYTLMDGIGARLTTSPESYIVWLMLVNGLPILAISLLLRGEKFVPQIVANWKVGALAGLVSIIAYGLVIWASTLAPIAMVSAIRETSMVFAIALGVFFLHERFSYMQLVGVSIALSGIFLLHGLA